MTRLKFDIKEKVLLNAFGTENKEESVANIYGADQIATPWHGGLGIEVLNVLYVLFDSETTLEAVQRDCNDCQREG